MVKFINIKAISAVLFTIFFLVSLLLSQEEAKSVSFALVGDIMLGSDYNDNRLPPDEGRELFADAAQYLSAADVAIGNLEGAITSAEKCIKNVANGNVYAFRMPPYLAVRLAEAGFDVLNTANNHSNDFGALGRAETERILDSLGIAHTGRKGDIAVIEVKGLTIAVIGFATGYGNFSIFNVDYASAVIESLDSVCDIVVATFHGGAEGPKHIHLPNGSEYFLGEERGNLRKFAHSLVDAGADIVFGHGPHVPRAIEKYRDKIIAYSLGNFCTWYGINVSGVCGLAPMLIVNIDCDGNFQSMKIISFEQQTLHRPRLDPKNRAGILMLELSMSDVDEFPYELLQFTQKE